MKINIDDNKYLGRAVFSSKQANEARKGKIRHNIFLEKENKPISVDLFGFCSEKTLADIQDKNATLRSTEQISRSFYGWAKIQIILVRKNDRTVKHVPLPNNPYHADIHFPKNTETRDERISHANELATNSEWISKR